MREAIKRFARPFFWLNLIPFLFLELVFFLTLSEHFFIEALLLQPIYFFLLGISICRTLKIKKWKRKFFGIYLIFIMVFVPLLFLPLAVQVFSKTNPEYTFWCGANNIPTHQEDIQLFGEMNVEFIISVSKDTLKDKNITDNIQNLVDNDIGVYINIGSNDFPFMDNYDVFIETYRFIRHFKFFDGLKGFTIDAEPSQYYVNELANMGLGSVIPDLVNNYPSLEEIVNATKGYQILIDLVHEDNKPIGIVKNLEYGVYIDTALRNIYYLKQLKWDFEIFMHYRISLGGGFRRFTDFEMYDTLTYFGDAGAMLGNFKYGYELEELLTDITICSSIGHERVYLFHWGSFIEKFDLDTLRNLKPYDSYTIRYNILDVINRFVYWHGLDWGNIIIGALA